MSVKFQFTRKTGDDMINVWVEGEGAPEELESDFAKAVTLVGLGEGYEALSHPVTQLTRPQEPPHYASQHATGVAESWGQPPVPDRPAASQKYCKGHNLPMDYKNGNTNGRDWAFWGCTAPQGRCEKEWA